MALITSEELQVTYVTFFARPADKSGYEYWVQQERDAALTAISTSDEAKLMYAGKGEASAIDQIYQNLLGRDSDPDGNYWWAKQLVRDADGNFTNLAQIALDIATAARNNPNINPITGKLDSLAIEYKIDAAQQFTEGLYGNPTAAVNYLQNQQAGKDLLKGISADSTPATVEAAVAAAVTAAAQGGTSGEGTEFTFSNTDNATLNDNTNIGFTPEKTYLADANDKIIIESFDSLNKVNVTIKDPSVKDADILTIALSPKNADNGVATFGSGDTIENIETIHINTTGAVSNILNGTKTLDGAKVLEIAGDTGNLHVNGYDASGKPLTTNFNVGKIDASGITVGNVYLTADTATTELVGGAGSDELTIGSAGGTMTGNAGGDKFFVGAAHDKLVTITDISKGDVVNFGMTINTATPKEAKALTITGASDETTFVDALQQAANKELSNGLYYAEYAGNTYVIANGVAGKEVTGEAVLAVNGSGFSWVAKTDGQVAFDPSSASSATDMSTWTSKDASLTGSEVTGINFSVNNKGNIAWEPASSTATASSDPIKDFQMKLTGTTTFSKGENSATVDFSKTEIKNVPISVAEKDMTLDKILLNGAEFKITDFTDGIKATAAKGSFTGTASFTNGIASSGSDYYTGKYNLNGEITGVEVKGTLAASDDAMKDDVIVKLAGSHTLNTEATLGVDSLSF